MHVIKTDPGEHAYEKLVQAVRAMEEAAEALEAWEKTTGSDEDYSRQVRDTVNGDVAIFLENFGRTLGRKK